MMKPHLCMLLMPVALLLLTACGTEDEPVDDALDAVIGDGAAPEEDVPQILTDLGNQDCHLDSECLPEGDDVLLPQCQDIACVDFKCVFLDREEGLECDDGDLCTTGDQCLAGQCVGEGLSCDDQNACTSDNCDPSGGCVNTYNQKPCDDGDDCTIQDHCSQGACVGQALQCDDGNPCTDDACSPEGGCLWTHNNGLCTDANACTVGDACADGVCVPGGALDCGESTECILNTCEPTSGCNQTIVDGPCEDGDPCTDGDTCVETVCVGAPVSCDDGNPCTDDLCQGGTGVCQHQNNTAPCDDLDACTLGDTCAQGLCGGGDLDPLCCTVGADETCTDQDPCTVDTCLDGYCDFSPLDCSDGSVCTLDSCAGGNCSHAPLGSVPGGEPLHSSFGAGADIAGWTVASDNALVTWQVDDLKAQTGTHSVYCGNVSAYSYDLGATDAKLTRVVSVPEVNPQLTYWITQDIADSTCNYDFTTVTVNGKSLSAEHCATIPEWQEQEFDLGAWAGQTVTLEFRFQTVDALSNKGAGVWIDEIALTGDDTSVCCLDAGDCEEADGCLAPICSAETSSCTTPTGAEACDDGDPCTTDLCDDAGACVSNPIDGCCASNDDCAGLACEVATCVEGACVVDSTGCCASDEDCPAESCVEAACAVETGQCSATPIDGCCVADADCDDSNACTTDSCDSVDGADGACVTLAVEDCCVTADDCETPAKACEIAVCATNVCGVDDSSCCADNADCVDENPCTVNSCAPETGLCAAQAVEACCLTADECPADDGQPCALPTCEANACGLDTSPCD